MIKRISKIYTVAAIITFIVLGFMPRTTQAVITDNSFNRILEPQRTVAATGTLYIRGYVYPIAELGNCSSKADCFEYCELMANIPTCANFSERHGIMKPGMAQATQALVSALLAGNRPGSCNSLTDCVAYCDRQEAYDDCSTYANKLALNSSVLGASTGVATAQIPRGLLSYCDTQASCAQYCESYRSSDCSSLPAKTDLTGSYITPEIQGLIGNSQQFSVSGKQSMMVSPRVKSVSDIDTGLIEEQLGICLGNAEATIIPGVPTTSNPYPDSDTTVFNSQLNQCVKTANDQIPSVESVQEQSRTQTLENISSIQNCFSQIRDFALEYQRCLGTQSY